MLGKIFSSLGNIFYYLFMTVFGLVAVQAFLQLWRVRATLGAVHWLLIVAASLVAKCRLLSTRASVVVTHGLSSCGSWALGYKLSSCDAYAQLLSGMQDLPRPVNELMSPALAGMYSLPLSHQKAQKYILKRLLTELLQILNEMLQASASAML